MIYLDNAATTKIAPEVFDEMLPYLKDEYGNPGTLYKLGRDAASAVNKARWAVAGLFSAVPENIIFTSGGSEGNSIVFASAKSFLKSKGKAHIVITKIEHESVLKAADAAEEDGFSVTRLCPDKTGLISADRVIAAVTSETGLVSVMYANNEIGTVNEVKKIGEYCRKNGILFHADCVQAAGQYDLNADENYFDFATISGHKLHAPKGIGALYVRNRETLAPFIFGGEKQEFGLRAGTENVPAIVGFGKACELAKSEMRDSSIHIAQIKQVFVRSLLHALGADKLSDAGISCNGTPWFNEGKILNLKLDGVHGESAIVMMDAFGVCISAGSACSSHESKPSHVLTAIGLSDDEARQCIRISFSKLTTEAEAEQGGELLARCITALRESGGEL